MSAIHNAKSRRYFVVPGWGMTKWVHVRPVSSRLALVHALKRVKISRLQNPGEPRYSCQDSPLKPSSTKKLISPHYALPCRHLGGNGGRDFSVRLTWRLESRPGAIFGYNPLKISHFKSHGREITALPTQHPGGDWLIRLRTSCRAPHTHTFSYTPQHNHNPSQYKLSFLTYTWYNIIWYAQYSVID